MQPRAWSYTTPQMWLLVAHERVKANENGEAAGACIRTHGRHSRRLEESPANQVAARNALRCFPRARRKSPPPVESDMGLFKALPGSCCIDMVRTGDGEHGPRYRGWAPTPMNRSGQQKRRPSQLSVRPSPPLRSGWSELGNPCGLEPKFLASQAVVFHIMKELQNSDCYYSLFPVS